MARQFSLALLIVLLLGVGTATAENIDPANRFAYAENVGWLNAKPLGDGGPGVQVSDFELTGWMWGENIGWISLSCQNTGNCGTVNYGVTNDGRGVLAGYAWGENVGWVNFHPAAAGVAIVPTTGDFSGQAWGENIGWISFASAGAFPFKVTTTWRCPSGTSPPNAVAHLTVAGSGASTLTWDGAPLATAYDIVRGSLSVLVGSGGDFVAATQKCLASKQSGTSLSDGEVPGAGQGFWYLIRAADCGGTGTYDDGTQWGSRNGGIAGSPNHCD